MTSRDFIRESFITGKVPKVILHYFEFKGTLDGKSYKTYNVFKMGPDFWQIVKASLGIPPFSERNCIKLGKYTCKKINESQKSLKTLEINTKKQVCLKS
jgi:hypothetical protein